MSDDGKLGRRAFLGAATAGVAAALMVRAGVRTGMVIWQGLAVLPGGQVEPAAAEVAVVMTSLSPVSGLFTVTV